MKETAYLAGQSQQTLARRSIQFGAEAAARAYLKTQDLSRETKDFIRKDIDGFIDNIKYHSKAAAYKSGDLKYPSELL